MEDRNSQTSSPTDSEAARARRLRLILVAGVALGLVIGWAGCRRTEPVTSGTASVGGEGLSSIPAPVQGGATASGAAPGAARGASAAGEVKHDVGAQLREELKGVVGGSAGKYNPFDN